MFLPALLNYSQRYKSAGHGTIVIAGAEYGSGSSRDWAAKGPMLLVSILDQFPRFKISFFVFFFSMMLH